MTKDEALTRARRGAAFLDEKLGRGWRREIKRKKLDMGWARWEGDCGCVIAQLEGDYSDGCTRFHLDPYGDEAIGLGFYAESDLANDNPFPLLTEAWREVLREKATA